MAIPVGVVCLWPSTAGSVPAGWARAAALDGKHFRAADIGANAGATGGSASHTHTSAGHTHGATPSHTHAADVTGLSSQDQGGTYTSSVAIAGSHTHSTSTTGSTTDTSSSTVGTFANTTVEPASYTVIAIRSDGSPGGIPAGALVYYNDTTAPAGWSQHAGSEGRYLRGAATGADGGANVGAASHSHTAVAHTHSTSGHVHTGGTTGAAGTGALASNASASWDYARTTHTHAYTAASGTITATSTASADTASSSYDPPFTTLLVMSPASVAAPLGIICLWLGTLATIPPGWSLCNGTGGTPDLRGLFVKAAVAGGGDVGTTGGALGHTHSNPAGHTHNDTGHTHAVSVTANGAVSALATDTSGTVAGYVAYSTHTHAGGATGAPSTTAGAFGSTAQTVTALADSRPVFSDVLYIQQTTVFTVAVTDPTPSEVESVPAVPVAWTIGGGSGVQNDYTLVIYANDGVTVVYTSGRIVSGTTSATVPSGYLHTGLSYKVAVSATDTNGVSGTSAQVAFSVLFTAPSTLAGLTATANPTNTPPSIDLAWTAATLAGGDTFVSYNIERRPLGSTSWTRIIVGSLLGTAAASDYTATPGQAYEYAVTISVLRSGDTLTSDEQSPAPQATLTFLGVWLHSVTTPAISLHYLANQEDVQIVQDTAVVPVWGRSAPTMHIGQQQYTTLKFGGVFRLNGATDWATVQQFYAQARMGATLCVRLGHLGERYFGVLDPASTHRADELAGFSPHLSVIETYFDEAA